MSQTSQQGRPDLSPTLWAGVDDACLRFEAAWQEGQRPAIEVYLANTPEPARSVLLRELLGLELAYRRRRGESPTPEDYGPRFSQHGDLIQRAFREESLSTQHGPPGQAAEAGNTHGAAAPLPAVPGYDLLDELGRGGMGIVYRARQRRPQRLVALKMILAGSHAGPEAAARFAVEVEAVARLQHPHIVQIHEVGEHDGRPYFALEYVDGGSLEKKLTGTPQPARAAAELVETLARAMHHAHQRGIVHRDLKPANVLLSVDGTPKVTDFGLAKLQAGTGAVQTQSGAILGTPSYMAPEQAGGKGKDIGPAVDVYALGALLYELLTGRPPFRGETPLETVQQVKAEEPLPPSRLQPKVPQDLTTICLKCLQKEPRQRYASAEALAEDLRRFLRQEPILARPVYRAERLWRWCRRNPATSSLTAAVAFLLVGLLVLGLRSYRASPDLAGDELLQTVAELDREDPGWRHEQLEEKRRVIPAEQNAAVRAQAAKALLPPKWPDPNLQQLLESIQDLSPAVRLTEQQTAGLRVSLQKLAPALAEARPLAGLRQGRRAITWTRDGVTTPLPPENRRDVAKLLEVDAMLRSQDGDSDGALTSCRGVLNTGRSLGDEPVVSPQVLRLICVLAAIKNLERALAQGEPSEVALATTQELLQEEAAEPVLLMMARGERGLMHWAMTAAEVGDIPNSALADDPELASIPRGISSRPAHAWVLRNLTRFVAIAQLPTYEQLPQIEQWLGADKEAPEGVRQFLPQARKLVVLYLRTQARLRCAMAAVAAERHRRVHGRWPDRLAALVPLQLREVPADPYDGAPLRYRRLGDGVVIYAVGVDRKDNDGTLDEKNPEGESADVGFRLWQVSRRRQAP